MGACFARPDTFRRRGGVITYAGLAVDAATAFVGSAVTIFIFVVVTDFLFGEDLADTSAPFAALAGLCAFFALADIGGILGAAIALSGASIDTFAAFIDFAITVVIEAITGFVTRANLSHTVAPFAFGTGLCASFAGAHTFCAGGAVVALSGAPISAGRLATGPIEAGLSCGTGVVTAATVEWMNLGVDAAATTGTLSLGTLTLVALADLIIGAGATTLATVEAVVLEVDTAPKTDSWRACGASAHTAASRTELPSGADIATCAAMLWVDLSIETTPST